MMIYASNSAAAQVDRPMPELGRLKSAAERISSSVNVLNSFYDRFHGSTPQTAQSDGGGITADNYRNDLESLFDQINRLEGAVSSLLTIG